MFKFFGNLYKNKLLFYLHFTEQKGQAIVTTYV